MSCQPQSPAVSLSQEEEHLLSLLAAEDQSIREEGDAPRLLASIQQGDYLLGAAAYSHRFGDTLLIGVMDRETGELTAPVYQQGTYYGTPYVTTFQQNGENCLLYTHNGMHQGLSEGSSGLIRLEGDDFTWTWPVEGDLRDESSQAFADYKNYWEDHLALLAPGGVDVFVETDYDVLRGVGPQWAVDHSENFYIPEEGDLPIPIPYQTRVWVENFTRDSRNALSAGNRSALYHIVSMKAEEPVPGQREGDSLYSLLAFCDGRAGEGEGGWLSAVLLVDQETGQGGDVLAWAQGDREEVSLPRETWGGLEEQDRLIAEYYQSQGYSQIYFPGEAAPEPLPENAVAIESIVYGDEMADGAMRNIAYEVTFRAYYGEGMSDYLVLQKDGADGSFLRLLGQYPAHTGKSARDAAFQENFGLMDADASLLYDNASAPVGLGDWREHHHPVRQVEPRRRDAGEHSLSRRAGILRLHLSAPLLECQHAPGGREPVARPRHQEERIRGTRRGIPARAVIADDGAAALCQLHLYDAVGRAGLQRFKLSECRNSGLRVVLMIINPYFCPRQLITNLYEQRYHPIHPRPRGGGRP